MYFHQLKSADGVPQVNFVLLVCYQCTAYRYASLYACEKEKKLYERFALENIASIYLPYNNMCNG